MCIKNRVVIANLLGRFIVSMQQGWNRCIPARSAGPWQTRSEGTVTVLHTMPTTHIADSSPVLEHPLNALSRYTALRVTEASSHSSLTAPFPEALILEPYGHKNFTIVINSLDTSFTCSKQFQVATSLQAS